MLVAFSSLKVFPLEVLEVVTVLGQSTSQDTGHGATARFVLPGVDLALWPPANNAAWLLVAACCRDPAAEENGPACIDWVRLSGHAG